MMPQGVQHRVVLVGVESDLEATLRSALRSRGAEVAAVCPDLPAARAEALANPGDTHLFITRLSDRLDPGRLSLLTSVLPGQPVVALAPEGASVAQVLQAQRAGAAQVVPLPLVTDDFFRALEALSLQFAPTPREAWVVAVCGVSGGSGATTLALNLAYELGQGRRSCLLVELSRQMGTLATYLDIEPSQSTHDLLSDASRLTTHGVRQAVTSVAPGLDVLVGPYQDIAPTAISPRQVYQLLQLCRRLAGVVVLDVPCTFDDLQFETLALADQVVLVGVQSVASVRTLKMVRDTLEREEALQDMRLVINRYEPGLPGFGADRLAELLHVPQVLTVANDYPSVMTAVNHGKPLALAVPHSRARADIRDLARTLADQASPVPSPGEESEGDRLARALDRTSHGPPAPRAVRVLHVEDDPLQQQAMALHLSAIREFNCTITPVTSEAEALDSFGRQPFDVVLLDYHLAQGNGMSCLRQLRERDTLVPIIVVSSLERPQLAAELLDAGADDFLSKENLSAENLARSLSAAVARADACKQRLGGPGPDNPARVDDFFRRVREAAGGRDETELLKNLSELHETAWPRHFSAAQIQRLVDLVVGELGRSSSASSRPLPRKALLGLFMRLFGDQSEEKDEQ
jgi:pilus assembly protein CpaE